MKSDANDAEPSVSFKYIPKYDPEIPNPQPTYKEISEQMRINADILMKEVSEHINSEIERFKLEIWKIRCGAKADE